MDYQKRVIDAQLDQYLSGLPAVSLEGAKGVGKTETARQRVVSAMELDNRRTQSAVTADPDLIPLDAHPMAQRSLLIA